MKFWDRVMLELTESDKTFKSIYSIMINNFKNETFSHRIKNGIDVLKTYSDLDDYTRRIAFKLSHDIKEKNTIIAISLDNSEFFIASFFGVLMAGHKPLLINYRLSEENINFVYEQTGCKYTITDNKYVPKNIIFKEEDFQGYPIIEENWANEFIILSSGTTFRPKIVLYDGITIYKQILCSQEIIKTNKVVVNYNKQGGVVTLAFLPFYHIFGLIATFLWLAFFGSQFVFMDNMEAKTIQYLVKRCGVTHFFSVPLVWNLIAKKIYQEAEKTNQRQNLEKALNVSLKIQSIFPKLGRFIARRILFKKIIEESLGLSPNFLISGGGYIDKNTLKLFNGIGYRLFNGYGSTETGIVSVELSTNVSEVIKGSTGKVFDQYDYIVENDILKLNGPALFKGMIVDKKIVYRDKSLFYSTNDIYKEVDGKLYIISRCDDVIIGDNGENITPQQIEYNLSTTDAIKYTCVLQLDKTTTHRILAIGYKDNTTDLQKKIALNVLAKSINKLPLNEKINDVYVLKTNLEINADKLPRNKIKNLLIEKENIEKINLKEYLKIDNTYIEEELTKDIQSMISQVLNIEKHKVKAEDDFMNDLNGSSLEFFELINQISSKYNIDILFDELGSHITSISISNLLKQKMEN